MSMMTGNVEEGSLKEALYETLNGILSPHRDTRQAAEQRIQALEVTDEFGIHLTEFVIDPNGSLSIRQLASVLLKQYVESHWSSSAEKFRPPEVKRATKERIKELLPVGLRESISKVRSSVAYAISAIAHWDWPENWPGLFDILVRCLSGESEFAVHGAMRVLTEFTRDLTDTQLPNVGPVILEEMYRIFQSENQYSMRTRGRAVEIFSTIATLVASTGLYQKGFIHQYLQPVIPLFMEKFVQFLRIANGPSDSGLKTDMIKAINCLMNQLPKYVVNFIPQILPCIWETMTQSAKVYQDGTVNGEDHDDENDVDTNDREIDSDGEIINFNNLIIATFEFIHTLIDHSASDDERFSGLLDNLVQETMYHLIIFMQITEEQIKLWTNNPSQFVEEDDEGYNYNVRISAQELLSALVEHSDVATSSINALCVVITRHMSEINEQRARMVDGGANEKNWWKIYESSILAMCVVKEQFMEMLQDGTLHFDLVGFFDRVVLATLNESGAHPFLLGRCLCIGGRYAPKLPAEMRSRFLVATVNGLLENQPACIRISAVKAVYWFCEASTTTSMNPSMNPIEGIMRHHLPAIFQGLFSLAIQPPTTQVLTLVMETLAILVTMDKDFTESIESKICPLTIAVFIKFHSDPEILDLCQDIFKALTENPQCIGPLQTRIVPTLISMMAINPIDKTKDEGTRGVALDVLQVLVQYSPRPLSSALVENAFPAACHSILNSEDTGTLQNGGEVIRTYLSVAARQVTDHRDTDGCTGLQYILQIVAQLLNPRISTLVSHRERPLCSDRSLRAVARVGQAVNLAVERFVTVGETIADDNPEIKQAMYEACKEARVAGSAIEKLCECAMEDSLADRGSVVRAARCLLGSVTRVLLLADIVVVKQLLLAKDKVARSLGRLESVSNFTEFVKAFSQFGAEMVELAHLTGDRQNDLKDERRRAQMAAARQVLERSTMMLLTSSKTCLRHPECPSAKENRDTVFCQMRRAMDLIHYVVKDGVLDCSESHQAYTNSQSPQQQDWDSSTVCSGLKHFERLVETTRMTLLAGPGCRETLTAALETVVERTQDFTDSAYTSHEHRENIILLCERAKLELNTLLRVGNSMQQNFEGGGGSPSSEMEQAVVGVLRATRDLRQQLSTTTMEQAGDLGQVTKAGQELVSTIRNLALTNDIDRLQESSDRFHEYIEHILEVCKLLRHVALSESLQVSAKFTEINLRIYGPQVVTAAHTLARHPTSKIAKENLEVFADMWQWLMSDVTTVAKDVLELSQSRPEKQVYMSLPRPGKHGTTSKPLKPVRLDSEEQAKIAKAGLEMKLITSEMDAETEKWQESGSALEENNDIVKRAKNMSSMAFSMYQFTRGEGALKTTQDLFTQAEYFAEEANRLYKVVRQFSYQVPGGPHKKELLENLDRVPTYVQQLQFTVKNPTVGKAATFTKVDNVIQETKNLMNVISKVVTTCFVCATKENIRMPTYTSSSLHGQQEDEECLYPVSPKLLPTASPYVQPHPLTSSQLKNILRPSGLNYNLDFRGLSARGAGGSPYRGGEGGGGGDGEGGGAGGDGSKTGSAPGSDPSV